MQENHYLVPAQLAGLQKNIEYSIHTDVVEDAEDWFVDAKERLLDVNNWAKYSTISDIGFHLTNVHSQVLNRKAHNKDHIRIDILSKEMGFDWAAIDALEYDDYPDLSMETFAMRIRPSGAQNSQDGSIVNAASSTIVIERIGKRLSASYHGRNESSAYNTDPAWLGISDAQWNNLMKGLID